MSHQNHPWVACFKVMSIWFAFVSCASSAGAADTIADTTAKEQLQKDAPAAWRRLESKYQAASGVLRRAAKSFAVNKKQKWSRVTEYRFMQRDNSRLVDEDKVSGFENARSRRDVQREAVAINDMYAFQIHRTEVDSPWIIDYRGRDEGTRDLLRERASRKFDEWLFSPFAVLRRPLYLFLLDNPAVRITQVSRVAHQGRDCIEIAFEYAPGKDPKPLKVLRSGTVVVDPNWGWSVCKCDLKLDHGGSPGTRSAQIEYGGIDGQDFRPVKSIGVQSTGPSGLLEEEVTVAELTFDPPDEEQFTLVAYGLSGFDAPKRSFQIPFNWVLFGLGSSAIFAAFVLRRRAMAAA